MPMRMLKRTTTVRVLKMKNLRTRMLSINFWRVRMCMTH